MVVDSVVTDARTYGRILNKAVVNGPLSMLQRQYKSVARKTSHMLTIQVSMGVGTAEQTHFQILPQGPVTSRNLSGEIVGLDCIRRGLDLKREQHCMKMVWWRQAGCMVRETTSI